MDFEDSFTYNIAEFFYRYKIFYEVVNWKNYQYPKKESTPDLVVLGPGPGVVEDYHSLLNEIKDFDSHPFFYCGICLGHQILGFINGFKLDREQPIHGQSVPVQIPHWSCFPKSYRGQIVSVQRYNSWMLKQTCQRYWVTLSEDGMFLWSPGSLSFQFHPESVGTSCPYLFFETIVKLAYNRKYHGQIKTSYFWNL